MSLRFLLFFIFVLQVDAVTTSHIIMGPNLPARCSPNTGDVWFRTATVIGMYECTAVNTWTQMGTGGGSGTVTSVGLVGTANLITVTGASPITTSGSWILTIPSAPTTKGDLWGFSTVNARFGVGANGTVLTADSTKTFGFDWEAVSGCTTNCVINNGVNTATAAMTLDLSSSTVVNAFKVPVGSGLTATANGTLAYETAGANLHTRTGPGDAIVMTYELGDTFTDGEIPLNRVTFGTDHFVGSGASIDTHKDLLATGFISNGNRWSISGCSTSSPVGGGTAGEFVSGTTGTCTVVITMQGTGIASAAPNGWHCHGDNLTNPADLLGQSARSTTTATLTGHTTSGDLVSFGCEGY